MSKAAEILNEAGYLKYPSGVAFVEGTDSDKQQYANEFRSWILQFLRDHNANYLPEIRVVKEVSGSIIVFVTYVGGLTQNQLEDLYYKFDPSLGRGGATHWAPAGFEKEWSVEDINDE